MFQRQIASLRILFAIALIGTMGAQLSCDKPAGPTPPAATRPTVASLSPAATDLLVGIGCADHLVAVSNYDTRDRKETAELPRVGDYQTTDWERIGTLKPNVLVIQVAPDRVPPGLSQRCDELGIKLVNIKIDTVSDIYTALEKLGAAVDSPHKAATGIQSIRSRLANLETRTKLHPPVRTLIVLSDNGEHIVGQRNFLNDLLATAGGINVAGDMPNDYPAIDREKLLDLNPDAIIQILPNASPQVLEQAQRFWSTVPTLNAVKNERITVITDWYAMLPGYHVARLAEQFAAALHPGESPVTSP